MEFRPFLRQFLIATVLSLLGILILYRIPAVQSGIPLAWFSLGFFILYSLLVYLAALRASRSPKKEHFINLIMGVSFLKMFFAFALIAAYVKIFQPESKLFALPFFGIYLIFTIFESAFLIRAGRR